MRSKIITYPGIMKNRYTVSDTWIVIDTKTKASRGSSTIP